MSTSHDNTLWLRPYEEIDKLVPDCKIRVLPGRLAALTHPLNKGRKVLLPDSERYDPDVATVVSSGIVGFDKGDVVVLAPDHGAYYPHISPDKRELRIVGVVKPWWESVLATYDARGLHPAPGWMLVELERPNSFGLVQICQESQTRTNPNQPGQTRTPFATVIASHGERHTEPHKGERVCILGLRTYTIRDEPERPNHRTAEPPNHPEQTRTLPATPLPLRFVSPDANDRERERPGEGPLFPPNHRTAEPPNPQQRLALVRAPIASKPWLQSLQRQT